MAKNTFHKKIDKIEWSINNKFYGKKAKNLHDVTCIMQLKVNNIIIIFNTYIITLFYYYFIII